MSIDISSLPVSGGLLVAGALWAGVSAFALGPLVAERSAAQMDFEEHCQKSVVQNIYTNSLLPSVQPKISCNQVFGHMPSEYRQLMDAFGMGAACNTLDQMNAQKQRIEDLKQQRVQAATDQAGSRCSCAISHFTQTNRGSLALYAGSARLITPSSVTDLQTSLMASANSEVCQRFTESNSSTF